MWRCSPPGTRLLMNIQNTGRRRGFNPLLAGRPEGGPSPPRAGTGYEPRRLGGGEAPGDRPPPHSWDQTLSLQMWYHRRFRSLVPLILEFEGFRVADSGVPNLYIAS